jgi:hypothetical protein
MNNFNEDKMRPASSKKTKKENEILKFFTESNNELFAIILGHLDQKTINALMLTDTKDKIKKSTDEYLGFYWRAQLEEVSGIRLNHTNVQDMTLDKWMLAYNAINNSKVKVRQGIIGISINVTPGFGGVFDGDTNPDFDGDIIYLNNNMLVKGGFTKEVATILLSQTNTYQLNSILATLSS